MYPVSRIVNLIFVAVFEGPIMLLTTVKFIFMQYQYIHYSTSLYVHTPSLKKYNFCHKQIYLSLAGKGLMLEMSTQFVPIQNSEATNHENKLIYILY